jgi:hypothetical protein
MLFSKRAPKESIVVKGARVLDPAGGVDEVLDVRVDDGVDRLPDAQAAVEGAAMDDQPADRAHIPGVVHGHDERAPVRPEHAPHPVCLRLH